MRQNKKKKLNDFVTTRPRQPQVRNFNIDVEAVFNVTIRATSLEHAKDRAEELIHDIVANDKPNVLLNYVDSYAEEQ